jgi:tyrosyl-tRNA synthetase
VQYFLRTADDDVERYLKLFTFLPIGSIDLVMTAQRNDASKRTAQHLLAKEIVELAHGAAAARKAELAHKEAFSQGTNTYSLGVLRKILHGDAPVQSVPKSSSVSQHKLANKLLAYKKQYAASSGNQTVSAIEDASKADTSEQVVKLPDTLLHKGSFAQILYAAGLVSSKSEGHRLIKNKGAYVVLPIADPQENAFHLKWDPIPSNLPDIDPNHYLVDFEALVLRVGKTKIQICQFITEAQFVEQNLSYPGWEARANATTDTQ